MNTPAPVVAPAPATPSPAPIAAPEVKAAPEPAFFGEKIELMVNGQKKTVTVKEARDLAAKAHAADDRFRDATYKSQQIEEVIAKATNPDQLEDVLRSLGANPDEIIDAVAAKRAARKKAQEDESKLTPEQRELLQFRREKAQRDADDKVKAEAKQKREQDVKYETSVKLVTGKIEEALTALNLPKNNENIAAVARAMADLNATDEGVVSGKFPVKKLLEKMIEHGNNHFKWATQGYNPEKVHQILGDEAGEAYLKWYLQNRSTTKKEPPAKNPVARQNQRRNLVI